MQSFDDYLQFWNAFSQRSSLLSAWINTDLADLKLYWAFRVFDFNDDNKICKQDIQTVIRCMCGDRLSDDDVVAAAAHVIREADQDDSETISRSEFKRMVRVHPAIRVPFHHFIIFSSNILFFNG